ncbi:alpha/beta hydrolase [Pseudomaricurvus sp.]|uniref:alpha/beta hydrolase n=1 Tax=Pseudomaricurvus sp. TaxID=2004510 RepID=UPI003F6C60BA
MKSSSRYFPARLMSAEVQQGLAEDVYLIKPNNSPDKSVELSLTHLSKLDDGVAEKTQGPALVLVHGSYQNRRLWWAESGDCLAKALVNNGIDVWLLEFRGHGLSPINQCYDQNTLEDYTRYDLPAVERFVAEQSGQTVNWLGYGTGAGALLASVALKSFYGGADGVFIGAGVPFFRAKWSRIPGVSSLLAAGKAKMDLLNGPEPEPVSFLQGLVKESQWFARRGKSLGLDLWTELSGLDRRIHWLASEEGLQQLDDGFKALQSQEILAPMLDSVSMDDELSQSQVLPTLTDSAKVASLAADITGLLETGGESNRVLSTGEASSAA